MNIYIARQPIFDRQKDIYGYELLYRCDQENSCTENNGEKATAAVMVNTFMNMGIDTVVRNKRAFINFSKQLIDQGAALLMPSTRLVVEISGDVKPDDITIESCSALKEQGYILALDDFSLNSKLMALLRMVDILKVDFRKTTLEDQLHIFDLVKNDRKKMIAKKIETSEDYQKAVELGYDYFQGFFFSKPEMLNGTDIPVVKLHHLQLLKEIHKTDIDFERLEMLIRQDVSLSYKLLKYINSMEFELRFPIQNIRQALTLLGQKKMIKWASIVALHSVSCNQPSELIRTALVRAHYCESLALQTDYKSRSEDFFLAGLFSLLDVFLKRPMKEILKELPLAPDITAALLGEESDLSLILKLVVAYEHTDWHQVALLKKQLSINTAILSGNYFASLEKADLIAV